MGVILILISFSVLVAVGFLVAFIWSVRSGQYEDTYSSSVRILFEDDKPREAADPELPASPDKTEHSPNQK
jgi:cbb3-type cytochrome oxidase maturation protein